MAADGGAGGPNKRNRFTTTETVFAGASACLDSKSGSLVKTHVESRIQNPALDAEDPRRIGRYQRMS
eukprot:6319447-Pyramimonas_sp.AAC.1